jgi:2-polyprenyl-3-methyl-5-hydroxy-6-metoxy-1,4-benzoquinol methylase
MRMEWFDVRSTKPEIMDDRDSDATLLFRTLDQFSLINLLFSRNRFLARTLIVPHMRRQRSNGFTVCDLGSGGCDFALWLSRFLSARAIKARIYCIDSDPRVVEYAQQRCSGIDDITVLNGSALRFDECGIRPDYIFSNHLLHHLTEDELVALISLVHRSARLGYVLNDLVRSKQSYLFFLAFTTAFLRNTFARADGLLSIQKAFTPLELARFVGRSGVVPRPRMKLLFPGRIVLYKFN